MTMSNFFHAAFPSPGYLPAWDPKASDRGDGVGRGDRAWRGAAGWEALLAGRCGIGRVRSRGHRGYKTAMPAKPGFRSASAFPPPPGEPAGPLPSMAIVAARGAGGRRLSSVLDPLRTGIVIGTSWADCWASATIDVAQDRPSLEGLSIAILVCADILTAELGLGLARSRFTACTADHRDRQAMT